ncbi:MAG: hypothetical protein L6R30_04025 [Thermoanaerobaculia bacterium]|nr:hypothetical protein [Thermoanaerobaculia bacterium]MCK6681572.1 hypothetical protein [Thermoanaerobaculia bacterium]
MSTLRVMCPDCESLLLIDSETGAVLEHQGVAAQKKLSSFEEAAQENARREKRAKDVFAASVEREKNKSEILEKTFQEALERAKKDPSRKPRGIFDLD